MAEIAKVGKKGRHVSLPDGYTQVKSGKCQKGDKFLVATDFSLTGIVRWEEVDDEDLNSSRLEDFDLLIRREIK